MEAQHKIILDKVHSLREWGISHGLPLERMFNGIMESDRFWFVYGVNPDDHSDKFCEYFEYDGESASTYAEKARASGWEVYLMGGPAVGIPDLQLSPLLLNSSEEFRTHLILHEAIHVWVSKYFGFGAEVAVSIDEGLAEYLSFALMMEWYREVNAQKAFKAAQYIGTRIWVLSETLHFAKAIRAKDDENRTKAAEDFLFSAKKWRDDYNVVRGAGTEIKNARDFNLAAFEYYGQYCAHFFEVREYFQKNKVNVYDFLSNPYPHREALLKLAI